MFVLFIAKRQCHFEETDGSATRCLCVWIRDSVFLCELRVLTNFDNVNQVRLMAQNSKLDVNGANLNLCDLGLL